VYPPAQSIVEGSGMTLYSSGGGSEDLEVMAEAQNYNAHLFQKVSNSMAGRHRILDFGAGLGIFAIPMRDRGHDVVCVEPEPVLRSRLAAAGLEVYASVDGIRPDSLEGIYTLNVLEHIQDDQLTIKMLYDRLAEGGAFTRTYRRSKYFIRPWTSVLATSAAIGSAN
jgi:2-polyprenyl-3-methyl-5-hydroxy-6-metoxy-1,4-benzoquinol methylase